MAYLTKSRFKEAIECPDRMFYYGKKNEYADVRAEDDFMQELAKTGIQVGELAKVYFSGGIEVETLDTTEAIAQTKRLLEAENIIVYEAALSVGNLLVRVDILIKRGNTIELIEAKSKSFFDESELFTKNGIDSKWREYVYDVTFQFFVASQIFKDFQLKGFLFLIDKNKHCTIDGLYQKFRLKKSDKRYKIQVDPLIEIGDPILTRVELTDTILHILDGTEELDGNTLSFPDYVKVLDDAALNNTMLNVNVGRHCKSCPYRSSVDEQARLRSGFEECWSKKTKFGEAQFITPSIFDLWNLHYKKLEEILSSNRLFLKDIKKDDLLPRTKSKTETKRGLSTAERQWIQIERALNPASGSYIDKEGLKQEFSTLKFPLHFIDFEVAMNGIPYKKGLRPYHQLAFQFSHHLLLENGQLMHEGQWIETRIGKDPNFDFVRKLRQQLTKDEGSILIYSSYENSILLHLHSVIKFSNEEDKEELLEFIKSITWCEKGDDKWIGERAMVDMYKWVFNNYLSGHMKNSNSIKVVLPAIINDSEFIQKKYSSDIYGSDKIPSKNFKNKKWLEVNSNGRFINPYNLLPPIFDDLDRQSIERLFDDDELANGGAAMCAYNLLQFSDMSEEEREAIVSALYKYCELDTLAMVIIYEGLKDMSNISE